MERNGRTYRVHSGLLHCSPFFQSLELLPCFNKAYPLVVLQRVKARFNNVPCPLPQVWLRLLLELFELLFILLFTVRVVIGRVSGRGSF